MSIQPLPLALASAAVAMLAGCAAPSPALVADMEYACRQAPSYTRQENCLNQYRSLGYLKR
jgi:hypothetical protein